MASTNQAAASPNLPQFPGWFIGVATVAMMALGAWTVNTLVEMKGTQAAMATTQIEMSKAVGELKDAAKASSGDANGLASRIQAAEFRLEIVERTLEIPTPKSIAADNTRVTP